jgi:hypothetical protein
LWFWFSNIPSGNPVTAELPLTGLQAALSMQIPLKPWAKQGDSNSGSLCHFGLFSH